MIVRLGKHEIQIDEEDAHLLSKEAGYAFQVQQRHTKNRERWYVKARVSPRGDGAPYLHRLIMQPGEGVHVDHINGDGRDNRRANLRLCDRSKNMANGFRVCGASGYRGVSKMQKGPNWNATITVNNVNINVHGIPTAEEAAKTRDYLALDYFGEFATLNFQDSKSVWASAKASGVSLYAVHAKDCPKHLSRRKWCKCGAEVDGRHKATVASAIKSKQRASERKALREHAA